MARLYLLASTIFLVAYFSSGIFQARAGSASERGNSSSAVELSTWEYALGTWKPAEIDRFLDPVPERSVSEDVEQIKAAFVGDTIFVAAQSLGSVQNAGIVTFDQPLDTDIIIADQRLLERLISGNPTFPPGTDGPEEYWDGKNCGECQYWEKKTLCNQAKFFYDQDPGVTKRIKHPNGGVFEDALRRLAAGGCV